MIKLITPPGMLLTVALLVIYAAYAFLIGTIEDSWPLLIGGAVSLIASYGTAMLRPWSRFLVYALTGGFLGKLAWSIIQAAQVGYFGFQFGSVRAVAWSLTPSLVLALLSCACCAMVFRHFRKPAVVIAEPSAGSGPGA